MKLNLILVKDVFGHLSTISADQIVSFEHSVPNVDGVKAIELSNERRLIVPNKEALAAYAKESGADPETEEGKKVMLRKIQAEIDAYKKGGVHGGMFPERWLPAAVAVLPEPFTEQNHMVNSTMKIVRGKVEKYYEDRIAYAYTAEGKELLNPKNIASL